MNETAERILAELRHSPELVDRWIEKPDGEVEGISVSPRQAAVLVRHGNTIGYTSKVGYIATYLPFARTGAKAPWKYAAEDVGETVWPRESPTPAQVLNWLQWHSAGTMVDIITSCYGVDAGAVRTRDVDRLRRYAGYQYQIEFFAANPEAYTAIAGRDLTPADVARWRERLAQCAALLAEPDDQPDEQPTAKPLTRVSGTKGARMFSETAAAATESTADPKPAVVKKKVGGPPAAVAQAAKGTKVTKATRKKVAAKPKGAAKPKAERKPRATKADDPYTKQKLEVQAKLKVGEHFTYHGPNKAFADKRVKVVGHESRGGIHIELGDKKLTCSPFALLEKPKAEKPAAKKKSKSA